MSYRSQNIGKDYLSGMRLEDLSDKYSLTKDVIKKELKESLVPEYSIVPHIIEDENVEVMLREFLKRPKSEETNAYLEDKYGNTDKIATLISKSWVLKDKNKGVRYTVGETKEMVNMFTEDPTDETIAILAKKFNRTDHSIKSKLKAIGLIEPPYTTEQTLELLELWRQGVSKEDLAEKYSKSVNSILYKLRGHRVCTRDNST